MQLSWGLAFNPLRSWRSLPYVIFGVTKAWESTETDNAIHFEWHTCSFCIFHILARPAVDKPGSTVNKAPFTRQWWKRQAKRRLLKTETKVETLKMETLKTERFPHVNTQKRKRCAFSAGSHMVSLDKMAVLAAFHVDPILVTHASLVNFTWIQ